MQSENFGINRFLHSHLLLSRQNVIHRSLKRWFKFILKARTILRSKSRKPVWWCILFYNILFCLCLRSKRVTKAKRKKRENIKAKNKIIMFTRINFGFFNNFLATSLFMSQVVIIQSLWRHSQEFVWKPVCIWKAFEGISSSKPGTIYIMIQQLGASNLPTESTIKFDSKIEGKNAKFCFYRSYLLYSSIVLRLLLFVNNLGAEEAAQKITFKSN